MRKLIFALIMSSAACAAPTAPKKVSDYSVRITPQHHNIPATAPDGSLWYVCETQPRAYDTGMERDHYIQRDECPATPIE
jgi:hypothetical protein